MSSNKSPETQPYVQNPNSKTRPFFLGQVLLFGFWNDGWALAYLLKDILIMSHLSGAGLAFLGVTLTVIVTATATVTTATTEKATAPTADPTNNTYWYY